MSERTIEPGPAKCLNCGFMWDFRLGGTVLGTRERPGMTLCPECGGWPAEVAYVDIERQMELF